MPKDDSHASRAAADNGGAEDDPNASGQKDKVPLKRGDACLYCRKRRIRCSAHKPTCEHCKKLGRDCVYDTGKPVSRVKQLEDKVAELQEMLVRQAGAGPALGKGPIIGLGQGQGQTGRGEREGSGSGESSGTGNHTGGGGGVGGQGGRPPTQPLPQGVSSGSSEGFTSSTAFSYTGGVPPPQTSGGSSSVGGAGSMSGLNSTNPFAFSYMDGMTPAAAATHGANTSSEPPGTSNSRSTTFGTFKSTTDTSAMFRSPDLQDTQMYHGRGADLSTAGVSNPYAFSQVESEFPVNMAAMAQTPRPQVGFDFGTLDPSFMSLVSQFGAASTADASQQQPQQQQQQTPGTGQGQQPIEMDFTMMMGMAGHGTGVGTGMTPRTGADGGAGAFPSPNTLAMMDTPALLDAFTRANEGFFDGHSAGAGPSGLAPVAAQALSGNQAHGAVQALFLDGNGNGNESGSRSGGDMSMSSTPRQGLRSDSGSGTSGAGPSPASHPSNGSVNSNLQGGQQRGQGQTRVDPRAASVSDFGLDEPSIPPTGAAADAQIQTVGVHLPGQDLVDGSSPIWRRDPVNIQQTASAYGSPGNTNYRSSNANTGASARTSFSAQATAPPAPGASRATQDMQREQIRANAEAFSAQRGWKTAYGYQSSTDQAMGSATVNDAWKRDPNMDGLPLVGGWFDAADLPAVARDHLLDIFFSKAKVFGQEFHVPRFYASLSLPPSRRPHPCLLYSMYTMAARSSDAASIRGLESHFYSIALRQLEEAVARCDRILDATRAAAMLAVYKYGLAKYHEGYMMTGMAARLGMSAGLHQISSSIWQPPKYPTDRRADLGSLMRQRSYILGPPADAIELGERIWAFWAIYVVDRCGAIAAEWPPAIPDSIVTTPFPKPLYEYELNLVTERDNVSLPSIWSGAPIVSDPYAFSNGIMMHIRALAILDVSSKLMYLPPEPGWEANISTTPGGTASGSPAAMQQQQQQQQYNGYGQMPMQTIDDFLRAQNFAAAAFGNGMRGGMGGAAGGGGMGAMGAMGMGMGMSMNNGMGNMQGGSFDMDMDDPMSSYINQGYSSSGSPAGANANPKSRSWTRTARIRNPKAYEEVRGALLRLEADLPPERQTNWEVWDGVCNVLVDAGGKRGGIGLHFCIGCAWMFMWDVYAFTAENTSAVNVARRMAGTVGVVLQRNAFDSLDTFIPMCWSFTLKILIREAKRLKALDRSVEASPIEGEIETILKALQVFGQRYNLASMQAMRGERFHRASDAETAHMAAGDDEDDAELFGQGVRSASDAPEGSAGMGMRA